jgi:hypothetical protein
MAFFIVIAVKTSDLPVVRIAKSGRSDFGCKI